MSDDLPIFEDERRCGGPVLVLAPFETLRLKTDDPFRDDDARRTLQDLVIQCLNDAGVLWRSVWLTRLRYIYDCGDDTAHRVFFVTATMPDPSQPNNNPWFTALKSIMELFRARDHTDLNIEIRVDTSWPFGSHKVPQLFPLLPSDPPEIDWDNLRRDAKLPVLISRQRGRKLSNFLAEGNNLWELADVFGEGTLVLIPPSVTQDQYVHTEPLPSSLLSK